MGDGKAVTIEMPEWLFTRLEAVAARRGSTVAKLVTVAFLDGVEAVLR